MNNELRNLVESYIEKEKLQMVSHVDTHQRGLLMEMVEVMDSVRGEDWIFSELTEFDIERFRLLVTIGRLGELFTGEHIKILDNFLHHAREEGFIKKTFSIESKIRVPSF